jgi:hypothetical protein
MFGWCDKCQSLFFGDCEAYWKQFESIGTAKEYVKSPLLHGDHK